MNNIINVNYMSSIMNQFNNLTVKDTGNKKDSGLTFQDTIEKAEVDNISELGENTSEIMFEGDMIIPQPPNYDNYICSDNVFIKSKDEMTLDEYKQWFMNTMKQMPVSEWVSTSFSSGALVIKEEAFERMKNDPEYEQYVLNRVRSYYSASGMPIGSNNVSYEVIGASPEECYGYAGPVGNSGLTNIGDDESWWDKRHKKLEELMEEIEKIQSRKKQVQEDYMKQKYFDYQKIETFLSPSSFNNRNDGALLQSMGVAITAYESSIEMGTIGEIYINLSGIAKSD